MTLSHGKMLTTCAVLLTIFVSGIRCESSFTQELVPLGHVAARKPSKLAVRDQTPCPTGWTFSASQQQCYIVSDFPLTALDAELYCSNVIGGDLVSIANPIEYNQLLPIVQSSEQIFLTWIGLSRPGPFGIYQWADGSNVTFQKWAAGQPQANSGDCVAWRVSSPDGWVSLDCSYRQRFICKQEAARCPAPFYNATSGTIASTNYPNNYENNLNCTYTIVSPEGSIINLAFPIFRTELQFDYVSVFDGTTIDPAMRVATISGTWSGTVDGILRLPLRFYSRGNAITVQFVTDATFVAQGWQAAYSNVIPNPTFFNDSVGEVQSPNYPGNYPSNSHQLLSINTVPGTRLLLSFDRIVTENTYDYIDVFDGASMTAPRIVRLAGQLTAPRYNVTSTGPSLFLRFFSDPNYNYAGYHATYTTIL